MAVIYEVNLTINNEVIEAFMEWLEAHIKEILTIEGFQTAEVFKVENEEATQYSVHYKLSSREALQSYFEKHAARLREDGLKRFPNQFSASRRILEVTRSY